MIGDIEVEKEKRKWVRIIYVHVHAFGMLSLKNETKKGGETNSNFKGEYGMATMHIKHRRQKRDRWGHQVSLLYTFQFLR